MYIYIYAHYTYEMFDNLRQILYKQTPICISVFLSIFPALSLSLCPSLPHLSRSNLSAVYVICVFLVLNLMPFAFYIPMTVFHIDIYSNYLFKLNLLIFKFVPCIIITFTLPLNYIICLTIFLFSLLVNIVYHGRLIQQISLPSAC